MAARVHLDFETASTRDLRRAGAHAYAAHPDTRVIVAAYAFDDEAPQVWTPDQPFPGALADHVADGGEVHAWNAAFELAVWQHSLARTHSQVPPLNVAQTHCTMA